MLRWLERFRRDRIELLENQPRDADISNFRVFKKWLTSAQLNLSVRGIFSGLFFIS
jgi:hypothetical protein